MNFWVYVIETVNCIFLIEAIFALVIVGVSLLLATITVDFANDNDEVITAD